MSPKDKIKAYLCGDHFERLCDETTCETCPSKLVNKEAVLALSKIYEDDPSKLHRALIAEINILRRDHNAVLEEQEHIAELLKAVSHTLHGNGKTGLVTEIAVIQASLKNNKQSTAQTLLLIGLIFSIIIGISSVAISLLSIQN